MKDLADGSGNDKFADVFIYDFINPIISIGLLSLFKPHLRIFAPSVMLSAKDQNSVIESCRNRPTDPS